MGYQDRFYGDENTVGIKVSDLLTLSSVFKEPIKKLSLKPFKDKRSFEVVFRENGDVEISTKHFNANFRPPSILVIKEDGGFYEEWADSKVDTDGATEYIEGLRKALKESHKKWLLRKKLEGKHLREEKIRKVESENRQTALENQVVAHFLESTQNLTKPVSVTFKRNKHPFTIEPSGIVYKGDQKNGQPLSIGSFPTKIIKNITKQVQNA